jgi:hypothetical protein
MLVMPVMQGAIAAIGQQQRPPGEQVGQEIVEFAVVRQGVVGAVVPQQRQPVLPVAEDQDRERISGIALGAGQDDGRDHDPPVEQRILQPRPCRPFVKIFQLIRADPDFPGQGIGCAHALAPHRRFRGVQRIFCTRNKNHEVS